VRRRKVENTFIDKGLSHWIESLETSGGVRFMKSSEFVEALEQHGFNFFAGVPDSILKGVVSSLTERGDGNYRAAVREDDALGMACGAYLAGKRPMVLMQNSGLGTSLNALNSLHLIYKIPCLLVISWRGFGGVDAPEHLVMGAACTRILEDVGIPYRTLSPKSFREDLSWAIQVMETDRIPAALLVRKGGFG
jgi:sulfopyruvate decarboxylase subunit alpha